MGSQINRALSRNNREEPYRGNSDSAKQFIKIMSIAMNCSAFACVGFIMSEQTVLNFHSYFIIFILLSILISLTTTVFVIMLAMICFAVGSIVCPQLTMLFETIKFAMILGVSSNMCSYFERTRISVLFCLFSSKVFTLAIWLNAYIREKRLQNPKLDPNISHLLSTRLFLMVLGICCLFMSLIGHRHIRRFKINPISISVYIIYIKEKLFAHYEKILIIIQLVLLKMVQNYKQKQTFISLLICCIVVVSISLLFKKISKALPGLCAILVISKLLLLPEASFLVQIFIQVILMEKIVQIFFPRSSMAFAFILFINQASLSLYHSFGQQIEENIDFILGIMLLIGVGWFLIEKREGNGNYSTVPL